MTQHLYYRRVTVSTSAGLSGAKAQSSCQRPSGCRQDQIHNFFFFPLQLSRSPLHSGLERGARPDLRSQGQSNQTQPRSCLSTSQSCRKLFLEPSKDTNPQRAGAPLSSAGAARRGAPGFLVPVLAGGASPGIRSMPADGVIAPAPLLFPTQAGGPTHSLYLLLYNNFGNSQGS